MERGPRTRWFLDNYREDPVTGDYKPACVVALGDDTVQNKQIVQAAVDRTHPNDGRVKLAVFECTNELADAIENAGAEETVAPQPQV
jgi:hypothetical protein